MDEWEKLNAYLGIATLEAHIRIAQERPEVAFHVRTPEGWRLEQVTGLDGIVRLPSLEIELPLAEFYERVEFPPRPLDLES